MSSPPDDTANRRQVSSATGALTSGRDVSPLYMQRFSCIGPDCEDNCCRDGWRIDVDLKAYRRLELATRNLPEERALFKKTFRRRSDHESKRKKKRSRRGRRRPSAPKYVIRPLPDNSCPMLEGNGFCHLHATFGEEVLPNVCAAYPRWLIGIGERIELTGLLSCPEVTRELFIHSDATDLVELDRSALPRHRPNRKTAARDVRPYFALQDEVREFMLGLLGRVDYPLEDRLFFMTYFANRTRDVLDRTQAKGDLERVRREMGRLDSPAVRAEISARFQAIEAPGALVVRLARELVRRGVLDRERPNFRDMVDRVFTSFESLRDWVGERPAGQKRKRVNAAEVMAAYRQRKGRIVERASARLEQYFCNFARHYCLHRLPVDSPDVLDYVLGMLTEMAIQKFLLFSQPGLQEALGARIEHEVSGEQSGEEVADPPVDEVSHSEDPEAPFEAVLDAHAVDVFYKVARYIEHSTILDNIGKALEQMQMRSMAGAVYLIRF